MRSVFLFVTVLLLTGCASMRVEDFRGKEPQLVLQDYFDGHLTAYGIIKDRSGKVASSFRAAFDAHWDEDGVGTLNEDFVYDNGTTQKRSWTFRPTGGNTFVGTASDIVGEAPIVVVGNTMRMDYTIRVPYKDDTIDLQVRDWLHLQPDGVILNHSYMRKFGFRVGELVITIIKDFPAAEGKAGIK